MPWLLLLHIMALLCWCGSLLYMPALVAGTARREVIGLHNRSRVAREIFTLVVTPAALATIASGTAIFLVEQLVATWLVLKLTLVSGLVLCHVAIGWLIFYVEQAPRRYGIVFCVVLGMVAAALMSGIIWLVLAKPF